MSKHEPSIVLIACYVGPLPWYFDFFLHTAKHNPTIDFVVLTDSEHQGKTAGNIKIIHQTLEMINERATARLGFRTAINSGYKLCDLKPAYGYLFPELIRSYDFWGYIDIDIVLGDIRAFITPEILLAHDVISVRHDYLTGFFQLFKNEDHVTKMFLQSRDIEKVLSSEKHFCFDETNYHFLEFREGKHWKSIPSEIESMMHLIKRLEEEGTIQPYFDFMIVEGVPGRIQWHDGKLVYRGKFEILLYHLIHFKKIYKPKKVKPIADRFRISKKAVSVF